MKLKWWFKVNQNKLYKKYNFDPHGYLIRKAQVTKSFKLILHNIRQSMFRKLFNLAKMKAAKLKKKKKFIKKKHNDIQKCDNIYFKRKFKLNKKVLRTWNYNFWNKFKNNYFNKNFHSLKEKKYSSFFFLNVYKSKSFLWLSKSSYFIKKMKILNKKMSFFKKKRISIKNTAKRKRKKLLSRITWLKVIKYRKKKKAWWLLRVTNKKAAFFYGIVQLKKFRYINKLNNRNIPLGSYYNYKLDSMLNIFLFRLNIFDNIYIVNNFIRIGTIVLLNNKTVIYPFRFVKVGDTVSFKFKNFKRMFNIFYKRSKFNRSFILKKMLSKKKLMYKPSIFKLLKSTKNFLNVPAHIEYNYKIMHFTLWRLPYESEFLNLNYKYFNTYIWSFETQLQYN